MLLIGKFGFGIDQRSCVRACVCVGEWNLPPFFLLAQHTHTHMMGVWCRDEEEEEEENNVPHMHSSVYSYTAFYFCSSAAKCYEEGVGCRRDYSKAIQFYK